MPPGVATLTAPVDPLPTAAVICVPELTVKDEALVLPNLTLVAPVRLAPLMMTLVFFIPAEGPNELMTGAGINVKLDLLVAMPSGVVTTILPVEPLPTTAVILALEFILKLAAGEPPKLTAVVLLKLLPLITILAPLAPFSGAKELIAGAVAIWTEVPATGTAVKIINDRRSDITSAFVISF